MRLQDQEPGLEVVEPAKVPKLQPEHQQFRKTAAAISCRVLRMGQRIAIVPPLPNCSTMRIESGLMQDLSRKEANSADECLHSSVLQESCFPVGDY